MMAMIIPDIDWNSPKDVSAILRIKYININDKKSM